LTDRQLLVLPQRLHHLLLERPQAHLAEALGGVRASHRAATGARGARRRGTGQATWPFRRQITASTDSTSARVARNGCAGAKQVSAPLYPSASSAILLHPGQPTANQARMPAAVPVRALRASLASTEPEAASAGALGGAT